MVALSAFMSRSPASHEPTVTRRTRSSGSGEGNAAYQEANSSSVGRGGGPSRHTRALSRSTIVQLI
jgi:hypothetical protein